MPGFPLIHPDHTWLAERDFSLVGHFRIRFYVEQPYAWWNRSTPFNRVEIEKARGSRRHLIRKAAAVRCYRSQVPLLGGRRLFSGLLVNDLLGPGEGFCPAPHAPGAASVGEAA